jgi:hypothetical protein
LFPPGGAGGGAFVFGGSFEVRTALVSQARRDETAIVDGAALAEGHDLLSNGAGCLGFRQGGGDALVLDQAANHVRQHRIAMLELAAQFGSAFKVSHKNPTPVKGPF